MLHWVAGVESAPEGSLLVGYEQIGGVDRAEVDFHGHISTLPFPSAADDVAQLTAATFAGTTAWAVGWVETGSGMQGTLVEQERGGRWSNVVVPTPTGVLVRLNGVAAVPGGIDVVGAQLGSGGFWTPLVMHYGGGHWRSLPPPTVGRAGGELLAVTAGHGGVMAVGYDMDAQGEHQPLVWFQANATTTASGTPSTLAPPPAGAGSTQLTALAPTPNGFAVGGDTDRSGVEDTALLAVWDGTAWSEDSLASPTLSYHLAAVATVDGVPLAAGSVVSTGNLAHAVVMTPTSGGLLRAMTVGPTGTNVDCMVPTSTGAIISGFRQNGNGSDVGWQTSYSP